MPTLQSIQPTRELQPYVRAYAQRMFAATDLIVVELVPAQLEQVINFELGNMPGVQHREYQISSTVWMGGAQTSFAGYMYLSPGVESFAIFFQPAGWSQLFSIPMREITNCIYDATSVMGSCMRTLWNRLGEQASFEERVAIVERFLLNRAACAIAQNRMEAAATHLLRQHGAVSVVDLGNRHDLGPRQFERLFHRETGVSPKIFARVARFQGALDAKLANPSRTWLDIAHSFGYYDQMHMIHDFESLSNNAPSRLISQMGDVRPPALVEGLG